MKSPALACILTAVLLTGGCDLFTSANDRLARAEASLARGEYNTAMVELKNVLSDEPKNPRAHLLVARVSLQLGNFDAVFKSLDDAAASNADARAVKTLRAQALLRAGKLKELQSLLESGEPQPEGAQTLRLQMLGARGQCVAAIPLAREAIAADAGNHAARMVVAQCYGRLGDNARAMHELEAAVAESPNSAEAWLGLGLTQQLLNRRADAEKSLAKASEHAAGQLAVPQQAVLYSGLADLQIARNDIDGLRVTHRKVLEVVPQAPFTELLGARLLLMEGKTDEALASLRRLVVAVPELGQAHVLLASAYLLQGSFEQAGQELSWLEQNAKQMLQENAARMSFDALVKAKRDTEEYWVLLGAVQSSLGQFDQARIALAKAEKLAPQSLRVAGGLAQLEMRAGNVERAQQIAADLVRRFPENPAVVALNADVLVAAGKHAEADALLQQVFAKAPTSAMAIARYRLRVAGKLPDADAPLRSWLESHPQDLAVRAMLAESLRTSGDTAGAVAQYQGLLTDAKESPVVLNNLAWLYHLQGDARALATAKRAWELAPKSPEIADTYGWLLVETGSVRQGLEMLASADAVGGVARPDIRFHYVQALAKAGERDRARTLLIELMAEKPAVPDEAEASRLLATLGNPETT